MHDWMQQDIRFLKGVGQARAALYQKLSIYHCGDLLYHIPRSYTDLNEVHEIESAPMFTPCAVAARVVSKTGEQRIRKGLSLFKVKVADDSGELTLTFYNAKFTVDALHADERYLFYGRLSGSLLRREMSAPLVFRKEQAGSMVPIYPLTAGLSSKMIATNLKTLLEQVKDDLPDCLPDWIRTEYQLAHFDYAIRQVHFPKNERAMKIARRRLIFEELLILSLAMAQLKGEHRRATIPALPAVQMTPFYRALKFTLTGAQQRAIGDALVDLTSEHPMNRLVQGDVGSGKTVVAAACGYFMAQNKLQTAVMAPTELVAQQHFETFFELLAPLGMRIGLLTGSMKAKEKRQIKEQLAAGAIDLIVGTHALLSEGVDFKNLSLVVTDEQHRFGVAQRLRLTDKGENPHVLVMSATPIPRTLALIIYGDLELSVIDELPPGRQKIETYHIDTHKRARAYRFVQKHLDEGKQAYVVCPMVEMGEEDLGLKSAKEYAQQLSENAFSGYRVGLLHGQMPASQKEEAMARFKSGEIQLLVSTTVVEVGVDVPNAVIMLIENADRFGLSQLHQLRGRVGRGKDKSFCILVSDTKNPDTLQRLQVMCQTSNGFEIAEQDLKLRGPGDFFGYRQHGLPQVQIADLATDMGVLQDTQVVAKKLLELDATLSKTEHLALRQRMQKLIEQVGERPN